MQTDSPSHAETSADERAALLARAEALNDESIDLTFEGRYDDAERIARDALAIRSRLLSDDDPLVAQCLGNLATVYMEQGRYDEALPLLRRSYAIVESSTGADSQEAAPVLNTWAMLHEMRGEFVEARDLYERALAILERVLDDGDPLVAAALNNLARLLLAQGDWSAAEPLLDRAQAIAEAQDHPMLLSTVLNNLGAVRLQQGDLAGAHALVARVHALRAEGLPPDHPKQATSTGNLGLLLMQQGALAEARPVLEEALAMTERAYGAEHQQYGVVLNSLGWLETRLADYTSARRRFAQAISVLERVTPDHPLLAKALANAAYAEWMAGRAGEARRLLIGAASVLDAIIKDVFPTLVPAEQRGFVDEWLKVMPDYVFEIFATDRAAFPNGYALLAGWKGLLLLGLRFQSFARAALGEGARETLDALQQARLCVANLVRVGGAPDELAAAELERERLERAVVDALPGDARLDLWAEAGGGGVSALRAALPADAALVDIYEYVQLRDGESVGIYGAAVVTRDSPPVFVEVAGPSPAVDGGVRLWLTYRDREPGLTSLLAERLWGPIAQVLPSATSRVWISPDGSLSRVPWSVLAQLHATREGALVRVAQVPSARALLELLGTPAPAEAGTVFLVGDIYFGRSGDGEPAWTDLQGTWDEVQSIAECARTAGMSPDVLVGADATPSAVVLGAQESEYVHVATHGFFGGLTHEEQAEQLAGGARGFPSVAEGAGMSAFPRRSPLATSGLALAGANLGPQGNLTAEEIVGLDLRRARLVVLSACDTGRGAEVTGQGVLGLQAAILAAGARALLMSLWPVDDDATAALMGAFYRSLWLARRNLAEALREAQEAVRNTEGWEAPLYWAGWSLVGEAF